MPEPDVNVTPEVTPAATSPANPEIDGNPASAQDPPANEPVVQLQAEDGTVRSYTEQEIVDMANKVQDYDQLQTRFGQQGNEIGELRKQVATGNQSSGQFSQNQNRPASDIPEPEITNDDLASPDAISGKVKDIARTTATEIANTIEKNRKYDADRANFISTDPRLKEIAKTDPLRAGLLFDQAMTTADVLVGQGHNIVGRQQALDMHMASMGYALPVPANPNVIVPPTPNSAPTPTVQRFVKTLTNPSGEQQAPPANNLPAGNAAKGFSGASFDEQVRLIHENENNPEYLQGVSDNIRENAASEGIIVTEENRHLISDAGGRSSAP